MSCGKSVGSTNIATASSTVLAIDALSSATCLFAMTKSSCDFFVAYNPSVFRTTSQDFISSAVILSNAEIWLFNIRVAFE